MVAVLHCMVVVLHCYHISKILIIFQQAIKTNMFSHQKQALAWMISRENVEELPPFWVEESKNAFKNSLTNFTSHTKPQNFLGGILADDMGVGKTLSIISLIVSNFRGGKPMVVVNKAVSVVMEEKKVRS